MQMKNDSIKGCYKHAQYYYSKVIYYVTNYLFVRTLLKPFIYFAEWTRTVIKHILTIQS